MERALVSQTLSWGGLQKHGENNKLDFLQFCHTKISKNIKGFLPQIPLLDQHDARTREARLPRMSRKQMYVDVPHPGNLLASEGQNHTPVSVLTMPRT